MRHTSAMADTNASKRVRLDEGGRAVVPAPFRRALGLQPGELLAAWLEEDRVVLRPLRALVAELRGAIREIPGGRELLREIIGDRAAGNRQQGESSPK